MAVQHVAVGMIQEWAGALGKAVPEGMRRGAVFEAAVAAAAAAAGGIAGKAVGGTGVPAAACCWHTAGTVGTAVHFPG